MSIPPPTSPTTAVRPDDSPRIAVVIPCYRVRTHILQVIAGIGPEVGWIIAVDDACPEASGAWIREHCTDPRVIVVQHEQNQGVGGATLTGYQHALQTPAHVVVKLDGDGQMDAGLLPALPAHFCPATRTTPRATVSIASASCAACLGCAWPAMRRFRS